MMVRAIQELKPSSAPRLNGSGVPPFPVTRLTVAAYQRMIEAGILDQDDPIELIEGWLVPKMPKNPPHCGCRRLIVEALSELLPKGWLVDSQASITTEDSQLEPDVCVIRGTTRDFLTRHPSPRDLALIIEVADTSLRRDRTSKLQVYARAGIPMYWIMNLRGRKLEAYSSPSGSAKSPRYRRRKDYGPKDLVPIAFGKRMVGEIPVRDLLP